MKNKPKGLIRLEKIESTFERLNCIWLCSIILLVGAKLEACLVWFAVWCVVWAVWTISGEKQKRYYTEEEGKYIAEDY